MFKKMFLSILFFSTVSAAAIADSSTITAISTTQPTNKQELNNPLVGSRQAGSEQIFGEPKISSKPKNKTYDKSNTGGNEPNNPDVGGRQAGSEQLFGQSAAPSKNSAETNKPRKPATGSSEQNNPDVGGRQSGSEQLFGQSAEPASR